MEDTYYDEMVGAIKAETALLINMCEPLKAKDERLASLAQDAYELGAMWAEKAATAPESYLIS